MFKVKVDIQHPGFSLSVQLKTTAKRIGLFGPSGSGKTTILRTVAGLEERATGRVEFCDEVWQDREGTFRPPHERNVGWLPQDWLVFPHLTARENLRYAEPNQEEFRRVVDSLRLDDRLDLDAAKLSGGERQRVALGRALLSEPRLLILDEPFSALDRDLTERVVELIDNWCADRDAALLVAAHAASTVKPLADEIYRVFDGQLKTS